MDRTADAVRMPLSERLVRYAADDDRLAWLEALRVAVRLARLALDVPLRNERDIDLEHAIAMARVPSARRAPSRSP